MQRRHGPIVVPAVVQAEQSQEPRCQLPWCVPLASALPVLRVRPARRHYNTCVHPICCPAGCWHVSWCTGATGQCLCCAHAVLFVLQQFVLCAQAATQPGSHQRACSSSAARCQSSTLAAAAPSTANASCPTRLNGARRLFLPLVAYMARVCSSRNYFTVTRVKVKCEDAQVAYD